MDKRKKGHQRETTPGDTSRVLDDGERTVMQIGDNNTMYTGDLPRDRGHGQNDPNFASVKLDNKTQPLQRDTTFKPEFPIQRVSDNAHIRRNGTVYTSRSVQTVSVQESDITFREVRGQSFLQIGPNNTIVDLQLTRGFLDEAKKGGELSVAAGDGSIAKLTWNGVAEAVDAVKTTWKMLFRNLMKDLRTDILRRMSYDLWSPLRRTIEDIFKKYGARMTEITSGSLVFVFCHADRASAEFMLKDKPRVRALFREMMERIGSENIDFNLDESLVSKSPSGTTPRMTLDPSQLYDHMQLMQAEITATRRENAEMKQLLYKLIQQGLRQGHVDTHSDSDSGGDTTAPLKDPGLTQLSVQEEKSDTTVPFQGPFSPLLGQLKDESHGRFDPNLDTSHHEDSKFEKQTDISVHGQQRDISVDEKQTNQSYGEISGATGAVGGSEPLDTSDPKKMKQEGELYKALMIEQAEELLSSLEVSSVGQSSMSREVRRLAESVAQALVDDTPVPNRPKSLMTLLCLDVSESLEAAGFREVKRIAREFVDGIETIAEDHELEENIGVVAMGGGARVTQQLTNDYSLVKEAIDSLEQGGDSPIFEALCVCVAAIQGRGGVLSINGIHEVRPRIIFLTDGMATNNDDGNDIPSHDTRIKIELVQLAGVFKKKSFTPNPIIWVPVGKAEETLLDSLAKLGGGYVVQGKDITTLCSYYRIQDSIAKVFMVVKKQGQDEQDLPETVKTIAQAFVGNVQPWELDAIVQGVQRKIGTQDLKNPDEEPNGYSTIYEVPDLPPLGTRVVRGQSWRYDSQDSWGPGTVINHSTEQNHLWVLWDLNPTCCRYRYGHKRQYDVKTIHQPRILCQDEFIEIGVKVTRGVSWSKGDEDGGAGNVGVVVRKRQDGKVKVRWPNGNFTSCAYGYEGRMEIRISDEPLLTEKEVENSSSRTEKKEKAPSHEEPSDSKRHVMWQWQDDGGDWRLYDPHLISQLSREFTKRPDKSCIVVKRGQNHRVMFKSPMTEKHVDGGQRHGVRRIVVGDEERDAMICKEISQDRSSAWNDFTK